VPDRHKNRPVPFRPPEGDRARLLALAERTGQPVNRILAEALAAHLDAGGGLVPPARDTEYRNAGMPRVNDDIASRAARFAELVEAALAALTEARALAYKGPLPTDVTTTFNMVSLNRIDEAIYQIRTAGSTTALLGSTANCEDRPV
jgi:hypothetical protein